MTQEEKQLLLVDLSARLPYRVMCYCKWTRNAPNGTEGCAQELSTYLLDELEILGDPKYECQICEIKPYLRSLSSLDEAEQEELGKLSGTASYYMLYGNYEPLREMLEHAYSKHIDLFGLIDKGLALESPKGMYGKEEEK